MSDKEFNFLNLLAILVKWKRFLLLTFTITLVLAYLAIYFFVDERFEASSLLLPSQEESTAGFLSNLKGLPFDLAGLNSNSDVDLYKSIIQSRSVLGKVINKFHLIQVYDLDTSNVDYYEQCLKILRNNISAELNDDEVTYSITVTAPDAVLAADMTNFIVDQLNNKIVDLKMKKSMMNREYLQERVNDIKDSLSYAENQLKHFQEKSGMLEAENQTKAVLETFASFQATLAEKQTEYSVYRKIYGENSPQTINAKVVTKELADKLKAMEEGKDSLATLLSLKEIPQNALDYFRYYRDVEIYTNILQFVLPLYEQAKFQEQKDVPILQVIDVAIPPAKRSFPKRTVLSLLITLVVLMFVFIFILVKENESFTKSDKFIFIKDNLFKWRK